ncbi:MAG: glycoside hydrolase family 36 protein [Leifsonia sp.]
MGSSHAPLVEIFTADEQRTRTSQAYVQSSVGARLRYVDHDEEIVEHGVRIRVRQLDEQSRLHVTTTVDTFHKSGAVRIRSAVSNTSDLRIVLTAVSSASFGLRTPRASFDRLQLFTADSEWLAENRWRQQRLRDLLPELDLELHAQDGRGHGSITSHGSWSTGEHLPMAIVYDPATGDALAWQIETSVGWHMDLSQQRDGATVSLFGPTDLEHQFAYTLEPGDTFETESAAIASSPDGLEGVIAALTDYRRSLRRRHRRDEPLPIVYNDFMNTLMGQPTTAKLTPLIDAAAAAGAEVFCIDAGWFADPELGDWWSSVGIWEEHPSRFSGGLQSLLDRIHALGMRSGIWLEPEVVGVSSPIAFALPDSAFFHRFGKRVREHDRYHLDFRHPLARAHVDRALDALVDMGISFVKLDYNINPGAGTELGATAAGAGLLGHARAYRSWLVDIQERHPDLLVENCSSGAMRADYSLLEISHLQSTSDQQDHLLYPPIAALAPASIVPEQCGNWAYPAAGMSPEETAFTLTNGLAGRLYLSGFIDTLSETQSNLVQEAVHVHRELRETLRRATPFWPLGFPGWDDRVICVGYRAGDEVLFMLWNRGPQAAAVDLPGIPTAIRQVFPAALPDWKIQPLDRGVRIQCGVGPSARVFSTTEISR